MIIHDRIYDEVHIRETVLIELINSAPLKRLQRINQAGVSRYLFSWKTITRFEHSVGVMLLLKKFGASITEQIAGLLHDVPHTAFSHVIDYVFENSQHTYHELFHEAVIMNSEIPKILKRHSIPLTVVHPEKFKLLERPIPDLCADRIDYGLRDYSAWKRDDEGVRAKLAGLTVYRNEFVFKDAISAEAFARDFLAQDKYTWSDPRESAGYMICAQAIRHALDKKIISYQDLFTDDETLWDLLNQSTDPYIRKKLSYLTPRFRIEPASSRHYHLFIKTKIRYVDPKVLVKNKLVRLSALSKNFKKLLAEHLQRDKGWYVFIYPG